MKTFILILAVILIYMVWQKWELTRFRVREYTILSPKLQEESTAVVLADLHGYVYGENNHRLLQKVKQCQPQAIFIPGDLIISKYSETFPTALELLIALAEIAPVYYSFGNHESRLRSEDRINHTAFMKFLDTAELAGVHIVNNRTIGIALGNNQMMLSALELDLKYYEKGKNVSMEPECLNTYLGKDRGGKFQVLLAHNPYYAQEYAAWGADVTFCGHNHGGLIRIPGAGSLLSPQLTWFPKYDAGKYVLGEKQVIVSRGLGTHTFHIRIFNRAELLKVVFSRKSEIVNGNRNN